MRISAYLMVTAFAHQASAEAFDLEINFLHFNNNASEFVYEVNAQKVDSSDPNSRTWLVGIDETESLYLQPEIIFDATFSNTMPSRKWTVDTGSSFPYRLFLATGKDEASIIEIESKLQNGDINITSYLSRIARVSNTCIVYRNVPQGAVDTVVCE